MSEKTESLRFSSLRLQNWKNFARIEVDLQNRVFLVGPNAVGKSNLLDVFRFLRDLASPGGGFQEAIRRRGGVSAIRCLAARRYPDIELRVVVEPSQANTRWEYELAFKQDAQRRARISKEKAVRDGQVLLMRPNDDDKQDPAQLTQTHLEQVNVNRSFRELASFFESVRYLHIVPQLVRELDRSVGRSNDPFGGDFLEQIAKTQERTRVARLKRIRDALRVAVPQLAEIELARDDRGTPHLRGKYEHWRPQGAWQTEDQFSDGTLRLMGLLWVAMEGGGPLLLEEPELSLHPEIVRYLPQMFARVQRRTGSQIILSTHSPDLLRDEGIGLDEVLLLRPEREGTEVTAASAFQEIRDLLQGGMTLADAVIPKTRPARADQLILFGDS
ncbi:MAG TPA: chromosome segregation protein SMC [Candidatus Rokubacteria bacterium]|nr:MAG: chromosome segregation protein SMC [Candidatus Rokubacteria bacterium GWA2_70_23]OGK88960.1 MAG: chromosome segregation protein SMC [Candidatus Rokubacteria bacterium GWF2_70_14]HAM54800.1 chromosome segregation protein SMC [Candidatus Rokubacteria bacterium]